MVEKHEDLQEFSKSEKSFPRIGQVLLDSVIMTLIHLKELNNLQGIQFFLTQ